MRGTMRLLNRHVMAEELASTYLYVRSWHEADLAPATEDVRCWGWSGHGADEPSGQLLTQRGHGERAHISS